MVSFKRLKNDKIKNKDPAVEEKDRLLQSDQKEANFSKSKNSRLRLSLFSKGRSKKNNSPSKNSPEYEPPTAPSSPADATPLNVTVLTSGKFDPTPYGVHRADTNISDLTPHVVTTPNRKVEFDPNIPKTPVVNNANTNTNDDNGASTEQPIVRGVSTTSTFSSNGISGGSTGGDHNTQTTNTDLLTDGTRSTSQPASQSCPTNDDFVSKTLTLFDDLCRVGDFGNPEPVDESKNDGNKSTQSLENDIPKRQRRASSEARSSQPYYNTAEDEDYDDESFMHSIETTVDDSSTNDRTNSINTNSMTHTTGTNYLTATTTQEGPSTQGGSKSQGSKSPDESTSKETKEEEKQPTHENFEVVLDSSYLQDSPKKRGWFSKQRSDAEEDPATGVAVEVEAAVEDDVEVYQHENDEEKAVNPANESNGVEVQKTSPPPPEQFTPKKKSLAKRFSRAMRNSGIGGKNSSTKQETSKTKEVDKSKESSDVERATSPTPSWNNVVQQLKQPSKSTTRNKTSVTATEPSSAEQLKKSKKESESTPSSSSAPKESQKQRPKFGNVLSRMTLGGKQSNAKDKKSSKATTSTPKKPKSLWKAVKDPKSGRTYYYHRRTRETTWTKPAEMEEEDKAIQQNRPQATEATKAVAASALISQKHADNSGDQEFSTPPRKVKQEEFTADSSPVNPPSVVEASLSAKSKKRIEQARRNMPDDTPVNSSAIQSEEVHPHPTSGSEFDEKWQIKKEINRLLTCLSPPDKSSVTKVMKEYEGNEEQLLRQLRDLVESQPFDEPFLDEPADLSREHSTPVSVSISTGSSPPRSGVSLKDRARTVVTHTSATTRSSAQTDMTEKVKNIYRGNLIDTISEGISQGMSISTKEDDDDVIPNQNYSRIPHTYKSTASPGRSSGRTPLVPRNRELKVEELTDSRIAAETYDANGRIVKARTDSDYSHNVTDDNYYGDNEVDTYGTDSVSALSENDTDFANRKENFEQARRRALDDAIEREDWELAAALSEGMRTTQSTSLDYSKAHGNWTQSELDKFISQNDWNAVSEYIAKMREGTRNLNLSMEPTDKMAVSNGKTSAANPSGDSASLGVLKAPKGSSLKNGKEAVSDPSLKKRIGSRSQLQHNELASESSWTSESSYDSSYDSEYS